MQTSKRFYRWSYYNSPKGDNHLRPHQLRDGDAFCELMPVLYQQGFEFGGVILNYPVVTTDDKPPLRPVDDSFIAQNDLVVMTTRPPIHDHIARNRKRILRSFTTLEEDLLKMLEPHLPTSTRLKLHLSTGIESRLPRTHKNRSMIEFLESGATYKSLRTYGPERPQSGLSPVRTACYLFSLPNTGEHTHNLLCVFGMGGTETLLWSYLLRTRHAELLHMTHPRFILAELYPQPIPDLPDDLSFADSWKLDVIADLPL
jgi:hypothetical protein